MAVADSRAGVSDEAVLAATGRRPDDWFRRLDERVRQPESLGEAKSTLASLLEKVAATLG